jgi:hypothetical protein
MPDEVAVTKPCKGITFQLAHAAKHVSEIEDLREPEVAPI